MKYGQIRIGNKAFQQVNKTKAERLFNEGRGIFLLSCNANPRSCWVSLLRISQKELDDDFKNIVNHFEYYNCNRTMGKYAVYFIKQ